MVNGNHMEDVVKMGCPTEHDYIAHRWQGCKTCPRFADDCDGDEEFWKQDEINNEVWKDETRS